MIEYFESLPFPATTAIAAIISVTVVAALSRLMPIRGMWAIAFVAPFVVAYLLYWAPYWARHESAKAEYTAWEPIALGAWGLAGVSAALVYIYFLKRIRKSRP